MPDKENSGEKTLPKALLDCRALLGWMIPQLDKFPRNRRFTLGERIESGLLFILERIVEAVYSKQRRAILQQANLRLEIVRHLWRLAYELKAVALQQYQHGGKLMLELGRQLGGWAKASRA